MPDYEITVHRTVRRFLRNHRDLGNKWDDIVRQILLSPRQGSHIDHLKGIWFCSYRWDEGSYRIKYEVLDADSEIHFYDANNRGDVYRGGGGANRRR